jgi:hypothetical protein
VIEQSRYREADSALSAAYRGDVIAPLTVALVGRPYRLRLAVDRARAN